MGEKNETHETVSPEWGQRPNGRGQRTNRTPELKKNKKNIKIQNKIHMKTYIF